MTRRDLLLNTLTAAGGIGLRSLLLGLPPSFIANRVMANTTNPNFLIYLCSDAGEPVNANCPGSYQPGVLHPSAYQNPVQFSLGNYNTQAAAPWANLPAALRNRMQFIHHNTHTNGHGENEQVMKVQGALRSLSGTGEEMLPTAIAEMTAAGLGTMNKVHQ